MSTRHLLSVDDLSDADLHRILGRTRALSRGEASLLRPDQHFVVGLVFLEPSLRTRVGFCAAAARLGVTAVSVDDLRSGTSPVSESLEDTLRVVAGYVDAMIVRASSSLGTAAPLCEPTPLINAGDGGDAAEHPTQALIDLFAIETMCGPIDELDVGICGDLSMRATRSLHAMLSRARPSSLRLFQPPSLARGRAGHPPSHANALTSLDPSDLSDLDVLYVGGMRHGTVPLEERERFLVDAQHLAAMPRDAVVLSPMPIVDELTPSARADARVRVFEQSDLGCFVRMAVLEHVLGSSR